MKRFNHLLLLCIAIVVGGCASSNAGDTYSRDQTRRMQNVLTGTVESTRAVKVEGTQSGVGAGAGAVVGGIAGSGTGQGRGSSIGAVLGAVAGGVVGAAAEEGVTRENALEITIRLDSGRVISVVQTGKEEFAPGDRVRVMEGAGETRVTH
jgi:outer membrane lipoprotein SlyB